MRVIIAVHIGLAALMVAAMLFDAFRRRRRELRARTSLSAQRHVESPPTLHPVVDPTICIGSGACVAACPEKKPLVMLNGRAFLADATGCIGHGACAAACPERAITLVFGTSRRGVDLPTVSPRFESSAPGVFVVGELGGMGLIANAVRQGVQAIDAIASEVAGARCPDGAVPVLVVGAGPAGIAAGVAAKAKGLRARLVEQQSDLGGTVRSYPRAKIVMTHPVELPGYGRVRLRRTTKEALIELWRSVLEHTRVEPEFGVRVEGIAREGEVLRVDTDRGPIRAMRVVLAVGRRGRPRRIGVEGEHLAGVRYALDDAALHGGRRCVVLGGGDSALEAALALSAQPGTVVTLAHRGNAFARAKSENRERVEAAERKGAMRVLLGRTVSALDGEAITLRSAEGEAESVAVDEVFALLGNELPTELLERCGVSVRTWRGEVYAPAMPED